MALIDFFLRQTATITPFVREGAGAPIYGPPETRRCRMERGKNIEYTYKNPAGTIEQIVAKAKMFCTGAPIPDKSLVECDGQKYMVIGCEVLNTFADHHLEVILQ